MTVMTVMTLYLNLSVWWPIRAVQIKVGRRAESASELEQCVC